MPYIEGYPFITVKQFIEAWALRGVPKIDMQKKLEQLKSYETEVMERLLLVRSEIDNVEQYLKT